MESPLPTHEANILREVILANEGDFRIIANHSEYALQLAASLLATEGDGSSSQRFLITLQGATGTPAAAQAQDVDDWSLPDYREDLEGEVRSSAELPLRSYLQHSPREEQEGSTTSSTSGATSPENAAHEAATAATAATTTTTAEAAAEATTKTREEATTLIVDIDGEAIGLPPPFQTALGDDPIFNPVTEDIASRDDQRDEGEDVAASSAATATAAAAEAATEAETSASSSSGEGSSTAAAAAASAAAASVSATEAGGLQLAIAEQRCRSRSVVAAITGLEWNDQKSSEERIQLCKDLEFTIFKLADEFQGRQGYFGIDLTKPTTAKAFVYMLIRICVGWRKISAKGGPQLVDSLSNLLRGYVLTQNAFGSYSDADFLLFISDICDELDKFTGKDRGSVLEKIPDSQYSQRVQENLAGLFATATAAGQVMSQWIHDKAEHGATSAHGWVTTISSSLKMGSAAVVPADLGIFRSLFDAGVDVGHLVAHHSIDMTRQGSQHTARVAAIAVPCVIVASTMAMARTADYINYHVQRKQMLALLPPPVLQVVDEELEDEELPGWQTLQPTAPPLELLQLTDSQHAAALAESTGSRGSAQELPTRSPAVIVVGDDAPEYAAPGAVERFFAMFRPAPIAATAPEMVVEGGATSSSRPLPTDSVVLIPAQTPGVVYTNEAASSTARVAELA